MSGGDQGSLRFLGGLAFVLPSVFQATPAFAEVCDKVVGDAWMSGHGPVWLLNPVWGGEGSALTLAAVAALGLLIIAPRLGIVIAAVFVALALWEALPLAIWYLDREVFDSAVHEGCASATMTTIGVVFLLALSVASIWRRRRVSSTLEAAVGSDHEGSDHA